MKPPLATSLDEFNARTGFEFTHAECKRYVAGYAAGRSGEPSPDPTDEIVNLGWLDGDSDAEKAGF